MNSSQAKRLALLYARAALGIGFYPALPTGLAFGGAGMLDMETLTAFSGTRPR